MDGGDFWAGPGSHRAIQRVTHDLRAMVDEFNDSLKTPKV